MRIVKVGISLVALALSSCATLQAGKSPEDWSRLRESEAFKKERAAYKERIGGKDFCWSVGVDDFLKTNAPMPSKECIYPASKFIVDKDDGLIVQDNLLKQNFKQLKVLQVTPEGFVIKSPHYKNDRVVFVQKTEETNIVDGSFLDEAQDWQVYEYAGTYSYATLIGSKTVHSFRRITKERLEGAKKGLKLYSPSKDLFIENKLWDHLARMPES